MLYVDHILEMYRDYYFDKLNISDIKDVADNMIKSVEDVGKDLSKSDISDIHEEGG